MENCPIPETLCSEFLWTSGSKTYNNINSQVPEGPGVLHLDDHERHMEQLPVIRHLMHPTIFLVQLKTNAVSSFDQAY